MSMTPGRHDAPAGSVTLGRGWLWPAAVATALLTLVYLPAHGLRDGLDLLASTASALGLLGLSVAVPRAARRLILRDGGPLVLFGTARASLDRADVAPARRLLAIAASAGISALAVWAAASLAASLPVERGAHAVSLVVLGVNAWLAVSNLVTVPPLAGWSLLLALLDAVGTPAHRRLARARRVARIGTVTVALLLAALALALGHITLLLVATLLAWYGWIATAVAEADEVLTGFLDRRRAGDLLRPVSSQLETDESVRELIAVRRPTEVALVFSPAGLVGAIGPRQLGTLSGEAAELPAERVMVPLRELPIVPATAPATELLPLLGRHGFVLGWTAGTLGYVEEHDLLDRVLLAADVRRRVAPDDTRSRSPKP